MVSAISAFLGIAGVSCRVASRFVYYQMPTVRRKKTTRYRDRRSNDPLYEHQIQEAISGVVSGKYKSFRAASRVTKARIAVMCALRDSLTWSCTDSLVHAY